MPDSSLDDLTPDTTAASRPKPSRDWSAEDRKVLAQAILRGSLVIVAGILALALPDRSPDLTAAIIGVTCLLISLGTVVVDIGWRTTHAGSRLTMLGQAVALAAAGVLLIAWPGATVEVTGRIVSLGLIALGSLGCLLAAWRLDAPASSWRLLRGLLVAIVGAVGLIFPGALALIILWGLALTWAIAAITSAVALVARQPRPDSFDEPVEPHRLAADWLRRYEMSAEQRNDVSANLYFEGATYRARLWRFAVLMFLSTSIATFGIASNSTAVVIGAMLIAPLMTPIMGLTGALVMAWPTRAAHSAATIAGGIVLAVVVSWSITALSPQIAETILTNSQVTSRVNPTLLDLGIALAAGAAGAFAISRPDVADSLPGVAIAVALVPPLAVVGMTAQLGSWDDALGATLLFSTNLVAIILAGGIVFILTGYSPMHRISEQGESIRMSFALAGLMMLVIFIPLALTSRSILRDSLGSDEALHEVQDWLDGTDLDIVSVDLDGSEVVAVITGSDDPPAMDDLGAGLARALGRDVKVEVRLVPSQTSTFDSSAD